MTFLSELVEGQTPLTESCGWVGVGIEPGSNVLFRMLSLGGGASLYTPLLVCVFSSQLGVVFFYSVCLCNVCLPDQNVDSLKADTTL